MTGLAASSHPNPPSDIYRTGACRDRDDFPDLPTAEAKLLCNGDPRHAEPVVCPARDVCRQFALDNPQATQIGVWGGLSPAERVAEWNRLHPRARCGSCGRPLPRRPHKSGICKPCRGGAP